VLVFIMYYFFSCENIKELRDGLVKDGLKKQNTHYNSSALINTNSITLSDKR